MDSCVLFGTSVSRTRLLRHIIVWLSKADDHQCDNAGGFLRSFGAVFTHLDISAGLAFRFLYTLNVQEDLLQTDRHFIVVRLPSTACQRALLSGDPLWFLSFFHQY